MAHFWETYSNGDPNVDSPPTAGDFVDRVLKFIRGTKVTVPAPRYDASLSCIPIIHHLYTELTYEYSKKAYITPDGPSPDPNLFNGPNDETKLFISTPIKDLKDPVSQAPHLTDRDIKYPLRVSAIQTEFRRLLGKTPETFRVWYIRLNYNIPEEKALENKSNRGMHLFQYDPNSDNKGTRAWRLFNELRYYVKALK
jgi:hypothetical protein